MKLEFLNLLIMTKTKNEIFEDFLEISLAGSLKTQCTFVSKSNLRISSNYILFFP